MQFLTPPLFDQLVNRLPKGPRLGWLTLKSRPQANGGRKNNSGHLPEHIEANKDNANPYLGRIEGRSNAYQDFQVQVRT
jgi:hypothetical protein